MGRVYTASFSAIAVAADQDLIELLPAANKPIVVHECGIGTTDTETSEALSFALIRMTATVTSGSGGAAVTPTPMDSNDTAAGAACERNNTTIATTDGSALTIVAEGGNILAGLKWIFPPGGRPRAQNGEAMLFRLLLDPSASITMSGYVIFEEL